MHIRGQRALQYIMYYVSYISFIIQATYWITLFRQLSSKQPEFYPKRYNKSHPVSLQALRGLLSSFGGSCNCPILRVFHKTSIICHRPLSY